MTKNRLCVASGTPYAYRHPFKFASSFDGSNQLHRCWPHLILLHFCNFVCKLWSTCFPIWQRNVLKPAILQYCDCEPEEAITLTAFCERFPFCITLAFLPLRQIIRNDFLLKNRRIPSVSILLEDREVKKWEY
jgi:hypothetical protein